MTPSMTGAVSVTGTLTVMSVSFGGYWIAAKALTARNSADRQMDMNVIVFFMPSSGRTFTDASDLCAICFFTVRPDIGNGRLHVRRTENGGTGDDHVGSDGRHKIDVFGAESSVHLDIDIAARRFYKLIRGARCACCRSRTG